MLRCRRRHRLLALPLLGVLSSCGSNGSEDNTPSPSVTTTVAPPGSESNIPPSPGSGVVPPGTTPAGTTSNSTPEGTSPGVNPPAATACASDKPLGTKRIVRLSFNQIANSIGTLIDPSLTEALATTNAILDSKHRAFPPLQSPREGGIVTDGQWTTIDAMASAAAQHVADNVTAVTGCEATVTEACARDYLFALAERAYRRPLTSDETTSLQDLFATLQAEEGATLTDVIQYGVYALLQAPQFVYRTELGSDWTVDGPITAYELASTLSYFLTDDMPDQALLDAAATGQLATPAQVEAQVDRILATAAAKRNLQDAMLSYFNYQALENVVIQDPSFTDGLAASMFHEGELFLENTLWGKSLDDLLLSRETVVNESLANVYGISPFPQEGSTPDADGFAPVTMPENRSGILTMPGFLSTRSRPTSTSVVGRGNLIKNAFLCTDTPPPPDGLLTEIAKTEEQQHDLSAREQATYRMTTEPCNACHASFDAYGLAVDNYDLIGRYRETDEAGRTIDTSVTLPDQIGGGQAADIVEVARVITQTGVFAECMARNLLNYSLADTSAGQAELGDCASRSVAQSFSASSNKNFASLVKSVAASTSFATRAKGAAQ